jgi:hypothetical protein
MDGRDETQGAKSPAESVDLVFLSDDAAVLAAVSAAHASLGNEAPSLRLVNLLDTASTAPVELRLEQALTHAKLAILRTTGKQSHAVIAGLADKAQQHGVLFAILAESEDGYESAAVQSSLPNTDYGALAVHFAIGTAESLAAALRHAAGLVGKTKPSPERWSQGAAPRAMTGDGRAHGEDIVGGNSRGWLSSLAGAILAVSIAAVAGAFFFVQSFPSQARNPNAVDVILPTGPEDDGPFWAYIPGDTSSHTGRDIVLGRRNTLAADPASAHIKESVVGRFAYGVPSVMIADQPYFLSLTISAPRHGETMPLLDLRLERDTRETLGSDAPVTVRPGDVTLGADMTATLTGGNFTVTEQTEARQEVDLQGGVTRWLWEVRGIAPVRSNLVLRLILHGADGTSTVVRTIPSIIDVRSEADAFLSRDQLAAEPSPGETSATQRALSALRTDAAPGAPAQTPDTAPASCTTTGPEGRKLALVIGNDAYTGITPLKHAKADALAMRDVLVESGFRVMHCEDLDAGQTTTALDDFRKLIPAARSRGEVITAFYYSGHGASTPTQNESYLLPVSLRRATTAQIESQGLAIGQVIGGLSKAGARRLLVIIDACRDVLQVEDGEYRGLQRLNWRSSADDIVAYATRWGEKARDNGLYAKSLARWIRDLPDADIAEVLNRVQTDVSTATRKDQIPEYADRMPDVLALRK